MIVSVFFMVLVVSTASVPLSIVGDGRFPALTGFTDGSFCGDWGAVMCDPSFLSIDLILLFVLSTKSLVTRSWSNSGTGWMFFGR